jgi:hypothetical protein
MYRMIDLKRKKTCNIRIPPIGLGTDAGSLFPEPGALEAVIGDAAQRFEPYLDPGSVASTPAVGTESRGLECRS